ncbi:PorV/PorQ family protein [candidate division KSB1 bacterium]
MKRMVFTMAVIAVLALLSGNLFAQGEATAEFLLIAPGARAGGLGEANVALANDAYATYWNPAGLALLKGKEFSGMHASWLPQFGLGDMYYDFASYIQHFEGIGTFGLSTTYLTLGAQEYRDENNNFLGTFDSFQLATGVSYGTQLSDNLSVGSSLKFIYMKLTGSEVQVGAQSTDGTGASVALDIGLLWNPNWFNQRLTLGMNLMNLGPKITFVDAAQADPIPTNLKAGFTFDALRGEFNKLSFTTEINKLLVRKYTDDAGETQSDPFYKAIFSSWTEGGFDHQLKRMSIAGGAEYWYSNLFALRGGYFYEDIGKRRFATFGAGIRYNTYQFDFGYIAGEEDHPLSQTMRFSLSFIFGSR